MMWRQVRDNLNLSIPWFLIGAYAYEHMNLPVLSDGAWDKLCRFIDLRWELIKHRHKWIVDRRELRTSSAGYLGHNDFPGMAAGAAQQLARKAYHVRSRKRRRRVS